MVSPDRLAGTERANRSMVRAAPVTPLSGHPHSGRAQLEAQLTGHSNRAEPVTKPMEGRAENLLSASSRFRVAV